MLGDQAEPEVIERYRTLYGLDRPLHEQYVRYFVGIARGDLGYSLSDERPVTAVLAEAVPATLTLGLTALAVGMLIGIPLGIVAALNRNKPIDRFVMAFAVLGFSIPNFFLGILLILAFSLQLRWLPTSGMGTLAHLVMPAITLGTAAAGSLARFTRSSMLEVMNRLYMRTALAKGVPRARRIVLVAAVSARDLAIVQGVLLMTAFTMVIANLLVDLAYGWLDPRIRLGSPDAAHG
jgi:peptide/nickel transport system permease protein